MLRAATVDISEIEASARRARDLAYALNFLSSALMTSAQSLAATGGTTGVEEVSDGSSVGTDGSDRGEHEENEGESFE